MKAQYTSKFQRFWRLVRLAPRAVRYRLMKDQVALYSCICDEFLELGGIYVKFLQGVLLQSDVMKNWNGANKYKIFEAVPIVDIDVAEVLKKELKKAPHDVFASFDKEPFATGSFGQVYKAKLHDGTQVIIKILRPHIRQILKFDMRLLSFVTVLLSSDFTSLDVSLKRAIRDFKVMTLREVDYVAEAGFAEEMYRVFQDDPLIFIPNTYAQLCTSQMIVQDFVPGVSVAEVLTKLQKESIDPVAETRRLTGSDLHRQLTHLGTQVLLKFFTQPRMPGDLHPGNVKLLDGDRVGIVDFGISARQPRTPNIFYTMLKQLTHVSTDGSSAGEMFVTYIKYFSYDLYLAFDRLSRQFGDQEKLTDVMIRYAQDIFDRQTKSSFDVSEIQYSTMFGAYVNKVVNQGNQFCIVTKVSEIELLRAVQTLVALIDSLGLRVLIGEIFQNVYQAVTRDLPQYTHEPANPLSLHEATAIIDAWLGRVALKNPELFLKIRSYLSKQKHRMA